MLLRTALFAAALACACTPARAYPTMPIYFVGDWCYTSQEGRTTSFLLPSWMEGGVCKEVLSVMDYGFFGQGNHCEPVETRLSTETAPSGTAYSATILARCQPDGPVSEGKLKTIVFERYKGSLRVTPR
jgi:hypothetical protein